MMNFITSTIYTLSTSQLIGFALISIGVIGTLMSPYRRFVLYFFAGIFGWTFIELVAYFFRKLGLSNFNTYACISALSIVCMFLWLVKNTPKSKQHKNYIGHTPMYKGTVPTSKWSLSFILSRIKED